MAFCTQCGATLSDEAEFCTSCGARLAVETAAVVIESAAEETDSKKKPTKNKVTEAVPETVAAEETVAEEPEAAFSPAINAVPDTENAVAAAENAVTATESTVTVTAVQPQVDTPPLVVKQPVSAPPHAAEAEKAERPAKEGVVATSNFFLSTILLAIPVFGLLFAIIWACGGCKTDSKRNFARSYLIFLLIGVILAGISAILFIIFFDQIIAFLSGFLAGGSLRDVLNFLRGLMS